MATKEQAFKTVTPNELARSRARQAPPVARTPVEKAVETVLKDPGKRVLTALAAPQIEATVQSIVAKPGKEKKPKLVHDKFTILKAEHGVLGELKQRAGRLSRPAKKSELLRAGITALAKMKDSAFLSALNAVPAIKTGRQNKT